jgi:hypothetical protein
MKLKGKQPEPKTESRLKQDSPSIKWDDSEFDEREQNQTFKKSKKKILSPSELNLKLRALYAIPFSISRYKIDSYLATIENANHRYFLKRYAINGKEFDVCWILLQEGI